MDAMSNDIRKKNTGEPGNKGQYSSRIREESGIELGGGLIAGQGGWDAAATPNASADDRAAWRIENAEVLDSQLTGKSDITLVQTLRLPKAGRGTEVATIRSTVVALQQTLGARVESWDGKQWQELHKLIQPDWIAEDPRLNATNFWHSNQREVSVQRTHDFLNAETRTAVKFIS